jgi:hypothetical protein
MTNDNGPRPVAERAQWLPMILWAIALAAAAAIILLIMI